MSLINIFLLDDSNNSKSELKIIKSKTYIELLNQIKQKFEIIPENYEIFILDDKNNEIKIDNEINYNKIEDILFIREINKNILEKSLFDLNYNKLSESMQDKLDEKYNCKICSIIIKNENPYLCYKCQKIFHEKCLKDWDNKCKEQNKNLFCPNCRNELSMENWNKQLDYEENRKEYANLIDTINDLKSNTNVNQKLSILKDKKIKELSALIKKYEEYINKTFEIFNNALKKMDLIHSLLNLNKNIQLNKLLSSNQFNINNINIADISNVISEEFETIINHLSNKNNNKIKNELINDNKENQNLIENPQQKMEKKIGDEGLGTETPEKNKEEEFDVETLYKTLDNRIIFRNGLLNGIVHKYAEINEVVNKIQNILAKGAKFNLVYKAIELGDEAETFHQMCDSLNMSLVLIETNDETRFGGFTTQSWAGNNTKKYDEFAFVFSLENNSIYDIIPNEPAIGCYPKFGPVFFGCQIRIYDKFFFNGGTTCLKGLNYKTIQDYELNNGKQKYLVKDIEVYEIETVDVPIDD